MRAKRSLGVACVLWLVTACGDEKVQAGSAAADLARTICDLAFRCCETGEARFYLGPYVTAENCVERITNSVSLAAGVTVRQTSRGQTSRSRDSAGLQHRCCLTGGWEISRLPS
jgi:hypothetical protein